MTTQDARPIKIEVKNLTKRFGDLLVLDDMNFTIRKGEFLAIVGPTGCGKTTFLNCLSKLMPTSEGDIYIDGEPPIRKSTTFPSCSKSPPASRGAPCAKTSPTAWKSSGGTRSSSKASSTPSFPSSGSRTPPNSTLIRFPPAWGSASPWPAPSPSDLLMMDEPYGQLDIKLRFYLEDELVKLWKALGSTVLFVTHNIEEAVYVAERILVLTNKPTNIKKEIVVDLPRPRDTVSDDFIRIRKQVTELIRWW